MPNNNSDNQAKLDREHSVWDVQKADVERLLGEIVKRCQEAEYHEDLAIDMVEQDATDALAVLENMEEGEAPTHPGHTGDPNVDALLDKGYELGEALKYAEPPVEERLAPPPTPLYTCPGCNVFPCVCEKPPAEEPEKILSEFECSQCGNVFHLEEYPETCSKCGASMEGE